MGRFCFLKFLLVLAFLGLFFSPGFGRKLMETAEVGDSFVQAAEEIAGNSRELNEELDYQLDPVPNTNPKTGFINGPPPQGK